MFRVKAEGPRPISRPRTRRSRGPAAMPDHDPATHVVPQPAPSSRRAGAWRRLRVVALLLGACVLASATVAIASFGSAPSAILTVTSGGLTASANHNGSALISLSNALGGAASTGCLTITNTGSVKANVHLYGTVAGSLAPYLTLVVTRGTDASANYGSCATFVPDATDYIGSGAGVIYSGLLSAYPASYAAGVVDPPTGAATWPANDRHAYKLSITLASNAAAEGLSATSTFTWGANSTTTPNR